MQTSIKSATTNEAHPKDVSKAGLHSPLSRYWLCGVFALALTVRFWFAFADGHSAIVWSCDASEYIRDARGLANLFANQQNSTLFSDSFKTIFSDPGVVRHGFEQVKELVQAGPVFPMVIALSYAAFGMPITQLNWQAPVIFQCLLSAITCVLIAWIGKQAWGRNVGIAAGVIAALYPGFIVNSIRMYSESFSCFLMCLAVALTIPVLRKKGMFHSIGAGAALACLQLTRSIMVLVTGLTLILTAWLSVGRSRWLRIAGLIAGMALVFSPWLLFQQLAFGKSSIVVDRVGHYNLFIGTNIDTEGYLSYPYPDGRGIEKKNFGTLVGAQIQKNPSRFVRLMIDKPLRLYKFPWNDFRTPIGPFGINLQVMFHQLVLAIAAVGVALCLFGRNETRSLSTSSETVSSNLIIKLVLATLWAMHSAYILFITVPRYNLTSMPFAILFAGAGAVVVIQALRGTSSALSKRHAWTLIAALGLAMVSARIEWFSSVFAPAGVSSMVALAVAGLAQVILLGSFFFILYKAQQKRLAKLLPIGMALVVIPLCALPLKSHGPYFEKALSGASIKQSIAIPDAKIDAVSSRDCYLLIDCDNWQALGNSAQVSVDGIELNGPIIPIMPFAQSLSETKSRMGSVGFQPALRAGSAQAPHGQDARAPQEQHYLECEDIYSSVTRAAGGGNLDMRQWFAISVPQSIIADALKRKERNLNVEVKPNQVSGSKLYGAFSDGRADGVRIPSVARYSWEQAFYGVENENGFTDSRYEDRIIVEPIKTANTACSITPQPNIRLLVAPPATPEKQPSFSGSRSNNSGSGQVKLNAEQLAAYNDKTVWLANVTGSVTSQASTQENIPVNITAMYESIDQNGMKHRYRSPWVPSSIVSSPGSNTFRFAMPFQPGGLPGKLTSISVDCTPGGVASGREFFSVNGPSKNRIPTGSLTDHQSIDSLSIELIDVSANPIGYGYEVL